MNENLIHLLVCFNLMNPDNAQRLLEINQQFEKEELKKQDD